MASRRPSKGIGSHASSRAFAHTLRVVASAVGCVFVLWLGGCQPSQESAPPSSELGAPALARVDGEVITPRALFARKAPTVVEEREKLLNAAIDDVLLSLEARRRKLERSNQVAPRLQAIRRRAAAAERTLLREALIVDISRKMRLSESEFKEHYEAHPDIYREQLYTVRVARFSTSDDAIAAMKTLQAKRELEGVSFERFGPSKGVELPRGVRREVNRGLRVGGLAIAKDGPDWIVVEFVERGFSSTDSYEDVRAQVRQSLQRERMREELDELLGELRVDAVIEVDESLLRDDRLWLERSTPDNDAVDETTGAGS